MQFEVRDMLIMRDTLKQMGITFDQVDDECIQIGRSYHNIMINGHDGTISYDDMNSSEVNKIKQTYMVNWYKDRAIREGMQVEQETKANGEIEIRIVG